MPARQRSSRQTSGETDYSKHDPAFIINKIGIYGWRKRCLYFLILLILIMAIINLALTIWIIRVQDFGLHGMGKLHITKNGIRMDGTAEFMAALRAKTITSRKHSPIKINSRKNITLSAVDSNNQVLGQLTLDSNQIILKNKQLLIQDQTGRTLVYADDKKIKMDIANMDITVPGGLNFEHSVQTPLVEAGNSQGLRLESLTKKLHINAASGLDLNSFGSDIKFQSLMDTKFVSKKGKIVLDAKNIVIKNLRQSTVPDSAISQSTAADVYGGIAEVCMCKDGTLFLAPPDYKLPCKVTSGVCL